MNAPSPEADHGAPEAASAPGERSPRRNAVVLLLLLALLAGSATALFLMLESAKRRLGTGDYGGAEQALEQLEGGALEGTLDGTLDGTEPEE